MDIEQIRKAMQETVGAIMPPPERKTVVRAVAERLPKGVYQCPKCDNRIQVHVPVWAVECVRHSEGPVSMIRKGGK